MPTWKPDYKRSLYLRIHFYLSILLSVICLGAAGWLLLQQQSMQSAWALVVALILIGSVPGVIVADQEREVL